MILLTEVPSVITFIETEVASWLRGLGEAGLGVSASRVQLRFEKMKNVWRWAGHGCTTI